MKPITLSDPTIGEGTLDPNEPVEPETGIYMTVYRGELVWLDADGTIYRTPGELDDCPF